MKPLESSQKSISKGDFFKRPVDGSSKRSRQKSSKKKVVEVIGEESL